MAADSQSVRFGGSGHSPEGGTDWAGALRDSRLRVTPTRLAVLAAVEEIPHADADTVIQRVRARIGSVSTQAVYDSLHTLVGARMLRRIEPAGHPARYETRTGDNHHHLVCRVCATLTDVDCAVGSQPCLQPSDDHGYLVDEAEVVYWGLCPKCQSQTAADTESPPPTVPSTTT